MLLLDRRTSKRDVVKNKPHGIEKCELVGIAEIVLNERCPWLSLLSFERFGGPLLAGIFVLI